MGNPIRPHGAVIVIATSGGFSVVGIARDNDVATGRSIQLPAKRPAETVVPDPTGAAEDRNPATKEARAGS